MISSIVPRRCLVALVTVSVIAGLSGCSESKPSSVAASDSNGVDTVESGHDNSDAASLGDLMMGDLVVTATGAKDTGRTGDEESGDGGRLIYRLSGVKYHVVGTRGALVERGEELDVGVWMEGGKPTLRPEDLVGPLVVIRTPLDDGVPADHGLSRVAVTIEVSDLAVVVGGVEGQYGPELSRFVDHLVENGVAPGRQDAVLAWLEENARREADSGTFGQAYADFYWDERRGPPTTEDAYPKIPFLLVLEGFEGSEAKAVSLTGADGRDIFAMRVSVGSYAGYVSRAPGETWQLMWTDRTGRSLPIGSVDPNARGLEGGVRIVVSWADPPTFKVEPAHAGDVLDSVEPSEGTIVRDP